MSALEIGNQINGLVEAVEGRNRRCDFDRRSDLIIGNPGSQCCGAVCIQTICASVDCADCNNDKFFGFSIQPFAAGIGRRLSAAARRPADGLISEITLCENMTAKFSEKLPFGRYYVQEIATDEHYVLNGEKYLVNFEYMGQEMTTVSIDCGQFENKLIRGTVSGLKVDPDAEPVPVFVALFTSCKRQPAFCKSVLC